MVAIDRIRGVGFRQRASRSSTSTRRKSPARATKGGRSSPKFGRTTTTREWDGRTHSNYHSLQATLNRRFTDGLLIKSAYTFSKAIDEAPYSDWTEFRWNAPSVFYRNRALADHDIPHNFQLAASCTSCRSARGRSGRRPVRSSAIFGGWQLNGVFAAYSGRPFNLTASGASLNMPGNAQTPDQVKDNVEIFGKVGDDGTYFDTTAFTRVTEVRFGNVGSQHDARAGRRESRPGSVPHLQAHDRSTTCSSGRRRSTRPTRRISATRTAT